jgi:hypothetical protein
MAVNANDQFERSGDCDRELRKSYQVTCWLDCPGSSSLMMANYRTGKYSKGVESSRHGRQYLDHRIF